jgi:hypothetical protein
VVLLSRNAYGVLLSQGIYSIQEINTKEIAMRSERYSMEVSDYSVEVYGEITIREAFDLIHYFDQQGYTHLSIGHENSTMRITKEQIQDEKEPPNLYEVLLKDSEKTCRQLRDTLKGQDEFIRLLLSEDQLVTQDLKNEIEKLKKEKKMNEMMQNSLVKEIFTHLQEETSNEEA